MSEPDTFADAIETIAPGLLHWTLFDNRIHSQTHSYAVEADDGLVLVDPLPLAEEFLPRIESAIAICLTGRFHQRSAWRYQKQFGIPVYAPRKGKGYEGTPDHLYDAGDMLPGGLQVIHAPGPTDAHYVFYLERPEGNALFCADLLTRPGPDDYFRFVPSQFMDEPAVTRDSVRKLLDLKIDVLCPNHGHYVLGNVHEVLEEALEKDTGP